MPLEDINPHYALLVSESHQSPGDKAWENFCTEAEKLLGHSLDGDEKIDGYSLDAAYAAFEAGLSAPEYVAEVQAALEGRQS